jgi:glycosyltransferase involved in cell wall biosynthesis
MPMLKLSIITINLNDVYGLRKTINSVFSQNNSNYEFIIIDGGSKDGSLDEIYINSDKINFWVSEPDKGIYNAMNKGILKAKGEYLLFLNSGDFLFHENVLNEIQDYLNNFDLIYGNLMEDKNKLLIKHTFPKKLSFKYFLLGTIPHPCTFIKRTLFDKVGLYNEKFKIVSDWEFFIKAVCIFNSSYIYVEKSISVINTFGLSYTPENADLIAKEKETTLSTYFSDVIKDYHASLKPDLLWKLKSRFKGISVKIKEILNRFFQY